MPSDLSFPGLLSMWSFNPSVWLGVGLAAWCYARGVRILSRRGRLWHALAPWHIGAFTLGLVAIVVALESPLDTLSGRLFALHMTQHVLLLMAAPPLLLLGKPIPVLLVGAPHGLVRRIARAHARTPWLHRLTRRLTAPLVAWPLYVIDIWVWHTPALYQAALEHEGVHLLEHLCFLVTGILFWWVIVEPLLGAPRQHHGVRLVYAWAAVLPNTALGALFAFGSTLWYPFYAAQPRLWGISPLHDQQLGGIIMWLPGDMMYIAAAALLFFAMLARDERAGPAEDDVAPLPDSPTV